MATCYKSSPKLCKTDPRFSSKSSRDETMTWVNPIKFFFSANANGWNLTNYACATLRVKNCWKIVIPDLVGYKMITTSLKSLIIFRSSFEIFFSPKKRVSRSWILSVIDYPPPSLFAVKTIGTDFRNSMAGGSLPCSIIRDSPLPANICLGPIVAETTGSEL